MDVRERGWHTRRDDRPLSLLRPTGMRKWKF